MGEFINNVNYNNSLQRQQLTYKKELQAQKQAEKDKREEERQNKINYKNLLIDTEIYYINIINNIYNKMSYKKAFLYLYNNYFEITKNYINEQAKTLTETEANRYFLDSQTIFNKLNNKKLNDFKKINGLIEQPKIKNKQLKTIKKQQKQKNNTFNKSLAIAGGITTGFIWGVLASGKKGRKRRY